MRVKWEEKHTETHGTKHPTTSPITLKRAAQMQVWRVLPRTQKKHDQPIWDIQMKLCKDDFLSKRKEKGTKSKSLKKSKFQFLPRSLVRLRRDDTNFQQTSCKVTQPNYREASFQCLPHLSWPWDVHPQSTRFFPKQAKFFPLELV